MVVEKVSILNICCFFFSCFKLCKDEDELCCPLRAKCLCGTKVPQIKLQLHVAETFHKQKNKAHRNFHPSIF